MHNMQADNYILLKPKNVILGNIEKKNTSSVLLTHNLLQEHERNVKLKIFREKRASLFQSACYGCCMLNLIRE